MQADLEQLLLRVTGLSRSFLYAHPDIELTADQQAEFTVLEQRLRGGEPLAYLLGEQGFCNLLLKVSPAVLIPRPETEQLVEAALGNLQQLLLTSPGCQTSVLDLGTGSGAIALAIASEIANCALLATDNCPHALALAEENYRAHPPAGGSAVTFCLSDWYQCVTGRFDLIVANPPYVAEDDPDLEQSVLCHEPLSAVIAAEQGLAELRRIVDGAPLHLKSGGCLLLEHGWKQGPSVRSQLRRAGFEGIETLRDLAGCERISLGNMKPLLESAGSGETR